MESFYPLLAVLADAMHMFVLPPHFAMKSRIVSPIGTSPSATLLPNGVSAQLLEVDDALELTDSENWAPLATSKAVVAKLSHRVMREGHLLPVMTGLCMALLAEMYSTTSGLGLSHVRKRLKYRTSPIADFGISKGSVRVDDHSRLAYKRRSDGSYICGQDPDEHYWLYFRTARDEDVLLDLGLFTFNFCSMVKSEPYAVPEWKDVIMDMVPAFFTDREFRDGSSLLRTERKCISTLRDTRLHQVARTIEGGFYDTEVELIAKFMEDIAEGHVPQEEVEMACAVTLTVCGVLGDVLETQTWKEYPYPPER